MQCCITSTSGFIFLLEREESLYMNMSGRITHPYCSYGFKVEEIANFIYKDEKIYLRILN